MKSKVFVSGFLIQFILLAFQKEHRPNIIDIDNNNEANTNATSLASPQEECWTFYQHNRTLSPAGYFYKELKKQLDRKKTLRQGLLKNQSSFHVNRLVNNQSILTARPITHPWH